MTFTFFVKTLAFVSVFFSGLVGACTADAAPATLAGLMVEVINPAANTLWNAGVRETLSDRDWDEIKQAVATLSTAAVIVTAGGSMASDSDFAKSAKWQEWSAKLTATVQAAQRASDRKDQQALTTAGKTLVGICEGCHLAVAVSTP